MNATKIIAAASLALLAAAGAHAETYDGVLAVNSATPRAQVQAQAVQAARAGNVYGDAAAEATPVVAAAARADVRAQAVQAAHAPNQNLVAGSFVDSQVPARLSGARRNG